MKRSIAEELLNEGEPFMVGDVSSRFLAKRLTIEVLSATIRATPTAKGHFQLHGKNKFQ